MNKRGMSPIIATILLIALVVIIGAIVFVWFKSMTQEAITKFDGTNIDLICNEVQFDASYSNGAIYISNNGNVPIYSVDLKIEGNGNYQTKSINDYSTNWAGLSQGGVFSGTINLGSYEKVTVIPVLLGLDKDGNKKTQACDERNGKEIFL